MVGRGQTWRIHLAGLGACLGYGWLAFRAEGVEARPGLGIALVVGWVALAVVAWRTCDSATARWAVVGWAVAFRVGGIGVTPTWEDDFYRSMWDGYRTLATGNPYEVAPAEYFGKEDEIAEGILVALDQINHPEVPTIYGPVAQFIFAGSAGLGLGKLWVLKLLLVAVEFAGWLVLGRRLAWRGWVLVWWCPLAVTEIAFAGHPEAIGVAGLAWALSRWGNKLRPGQASWGVALAGATKPFGWVLAPFVVDRFGWKNGLGMIGIGVACYLPFWVQGSSAEWSAILVMGSRFEYNSTGYALLGLILPNVSARIVGASLTLGFGVGAWWVWRRGARSMYPPIAGILAVAFWWSPVFNPWYALWLLPSVALRPSGWGLGLLLALPLAYTHGWGMSGGAVVNYVHPWWTRPLEVGVVLAAMAAWTVYRRRRS